MHSSYIFLSDKSVSRKMIKLFYTFVMKKKNNYTLTSVLVSKLPVAPQLGYTQRQNIVTPEKSWSFMTAQRNGRFLFINIVYGNILFYCSSSKTTTRRTNRSMYFPFSRCVDGVLYIMDRFVIARPKFYSPDINNGKQFENTVSL